jgi:hypothetical protein
MFLSVIKLMLDSLNNLRVRFSPLLAFSVILCGRHVVWPSQLHLNLSSRSSLKEVQLLFLPIQIRIFLNVTTGLLTVTSGSAARTLIGAAWPWTPSASSARSRYRSRTIVGGDVMAHWLKCSDSVVGCDGSLIGE